MDNDDEGDISRIKTCSIGDKDELGLCFYAKDKNGMEKRVFGFRFKAFALLYIGVSFIAIINGFIHGYAIEGNITGAFQYAALMAEYACEMVFALIPFINIMNLVFGFMLMDTQGMLMARVGIVASNEWLDLAFGMFFRFYFYVTIAITFIMVMYLVHVFRAKRRETGGSLGNHAIKK